MSDVNWSRMAPDPMLCIKSQWVCKQSVALVGDGLTVLERSGELSRSTPLSGNVGDCCSFEGRVPNYTSV